MTPRDRRPEATQRLSFQAASPSKGAPCANSLQGPHGSPMLRAPFRRSSGLAAVFLTLLAVAGPSFAGVVGMRLSVNSVDQNNGQVDFDLTALATGVYTVGLGQDLDDSRVVSYATNYDFGYGLAPTSYRVVLGFQSDWNTFPHPAIRYDDGDSVGTVTLPLQGTTTVNGTSFRRFRGSFSHTYAPGNYLLRVTAGPDGEMGSPGLGQAATAAVPVGNPISGELNVQFSANRTVYLAGGGSPINTEIVTSYQSYPGTLRYITARELLEIEDPLGPPPPAFEIPTLSQWMLLILAAALGSAGLLLMRRP
ncbi:MAG: IPTL-CTERM sorting domain-containing protein [Acidobacteriota bacterium]